MANPQPLLRIALSARLMHQPPHVLGFRNKVLQYLEQSAAHWVLSQGALALLVPTLFEGGPLGRADISMRDYAEAMDGLILQGGADVAPESYGSKPLQPEWAGDRVRDRYEIELVWAFIISGKPVLGICRGCQLINVALGGTLIQDIPSQRPRAFTHFDASLYDGLHHPIELVPQSGLEALYPGVTAPLVTSIHHQCVDRLGDDLSAEALSPDGVIEAIRWRGSSYVLGVQWHPEFHQDQPHLLDSSPIMSEFLQAARLRRAANTG